MQVIQHGLKWTTDWPRRQECKKCKCIFIYDKKDIKTTFYENLHSSPPEVAQDYIYCPECRRKIILY